MFKKSIINKLYKKAFWRKWLTYSDISCAEVQGMQQIMKAIGYTESDIEKLENSVKKLLSKCKKCGGEIHVSYGCHNTICPQCHTHKPYKKIY